MPTTATKVSRVVRRLDILQRLLFAGIGGVLALYTALNKLWGVSWRDQFGVVRQYARALSC